MVTGQANKFLAVKSTIVKKQHNAAIKIFGQNVSQNLTMDKDRSTQYSGVSPPCLRHVEKVLWLLILVQPTTRR